MKNNVTIVSLPNCSHISHLVAENIGYVFCEVKELAKFELGDLEEVKLKAGVDYYRGEVKKILKSVIEYDKSIMFVDFDMFRHNMELENFKDTYKIFLDFGNPYTSDELLKTKMQEKIQFAKSGCDIVIDCNNYSQERVVEILKSVINE